MIDDSIPLVVGGETKHLAEELTTNGFRYNHLYYKAWSAPYTVERVQWIKTLPGVWQVESYRFRIEVDKTPSVGA